MQIYMKDGKALKINGGYLSPKASGETWVLNEWLDTTLFNYSVNFLCNNVAYDSISRRMIKAAIVMYYGSTRVMADTASWTDQAYRTITFLEPPTGDLLIWLQANGTKQQHQHIGGKD